MAKIGVLIFIIITLAMVIPLKGASMDELMPPEMLGWKPSGKGELYDRETIYDYMNGAGEIYNAYGFKRLNVQRYVKTGEPDIIVEVFDMVSSANAFGVFTHVQGRTETDAGIGQGSEYRGGLLYFWKGRFFVSILAERETPHAKDSVLSIGKSINRAIKAKGRLPEIINYLPKENLTEKGFRYFRRHEILNYHYFVADRNILNLNDSTEAVLARYKDDRSYLLLVRYKNEKQAKAAFEAFMDAYMPEAKGSIVIQIGDGKWTGGSLVQNYVVIVFDVPGKDEALAKLKSLRKKILR